MLRRTLLVIAPLAAAACSSSGATKPLRETRWYVPVPQISTETTMRVAPGEQVASLATLVAIDSASLRPVVVRRGGSGYIEGSVADSSSHSMHAVKPSIVTTYQGARYHHESIRALANDTAVMANTALAIVQASPGDAIILDFQGAKPNDLPGMVEMVRAIGRVARQRGRMPLTLVVPPGDTVSYPTSILARVADVLMIRLHGEHRPGTAAGPLNTPDFIAREIGLRTRMIGATRLGVELPLYGYRWNADGSAFPITYVDAQSLVRAESGFFTRDPVSQFLTASGRDGWTVWIPDARTVQSMAAAVKRRGISIIALAGPEGADPAILRGNLRR